MACVLTKAAKILFLLAAIFCVVGIIVIIASHVTASASLSVGFEVEGVTSGSWTVDSDGGGLGYSVHYEASKEAECASINSATNIKDSNGDSVSLSNGCFMTCSHISMYPDSWQTKNDPQLCDLGSFTLNSNNGVTVRGNYEISSSSKVWVVDSGEEIGEAVGGVLGAGLMGLVGGVVILVGLILSCVGCCCMYQDAPAGGGGQAQGTVIGQRS